MINENLDLDFFRYIGNRGEWVDVYSLTNPFLHNVEKRPKSCGVHTVKFLKYVWPFFNIMHERIKRKRQRSGTLRHRLQILLLILDKFMRVN